MITLITIFRHLLLLINLPNSEAANCFTPNKPFPIFYGGHSGSTSFTSLDYDPNTGSILAGGSSSSLALVPQTRPIVVLFTSTGQISWSSYLQSHTSTQLIRFNDDYTKILVASNAVSGLPTWLAFVDSSSGSLLNQFDFLQGINAAPLKINDIESLGSSIYLSMETDNYNFQVAKYTLTGGTLVYDWDISSSVQSTATQSIIASGSLYSAGTYFATAVDKMVALLKIDMVGGTISWGYYNQRTINTAGYYSIEFIKYKEENGVKVIAALDNPITLYWYNGFTFHFLYLDGSGDVSSKQHYYCDKNDADGLGDGGQIIDIYINTVSATQVHMYAYQYFRLSTNALYSFNAVSGAMSITYYFFSQVPAGSIFTAIMITNSLSYFAGSSSAFYNVNGGGTHTFSQSVGFIIPQYDPTNSCIYQANSLTGSSFLAYTSVSYGLSSFAPAQISNPYSAAISNQQFVSTIMPNAVTKSPWCDSTSLQTITPSSISDQSYTVNSGSSAFGFSDFTIGNVCDDLVWIYTYKDQGSGQELSFLTLDSATRTFAISSGDSSTVGSYTIQVTGMLPNYQYGTTTFTLDVLDECTSEVLVSLNPSGPFQYDAKLAPTTSLFTNSWTGLAPCLSRAVYSLTLPPPLTSEITIFTDISNNQIIQIQTSDLNLVGTHSVTLTAQIPTLTPYTHTFTIDIISSCQDTTFTYKNTVTDTFYYQINTGSKILFTPAFTQSLPYCPTITYQFLESSVIIPYIGISWGYAVASTASAIYVGNWVIEMQGIVKETLYPITYLTESINFNLNIVDCSTAIFNVIQVPNQEYILGDKLNIKITPWTTTNPSDCGIITYTTSVTPTLDALVQTSDLEMDLYSIAMSDVGEYDVQVDGSILDGYRTHSMFFKINIIKKRNQAPYFKSEPKAQKVEELKKLVYQLPLVKDDEGDFTSIIPDLSSCSNFVAYSSQRLQFSPQRGDAGSYKIPILVMDHNKDSKNKTYELNLEVTKAKQEQNTLLNQTQETDGKEQGAQEQQVQAKVSKQLEAKIVMVELDGLVTVEFSKQMAQIANISQINSDALELWIKPGKSQLDDNLGFDWKITSFQNNEMTLLLTFDTPLEISQGYVRINVNFNRVMT